MQTILAVGAGGAVGAIARYLLVSRIGRALGPEGIAGVPVGILTANVLGSLLMGLLAEYMALAWQPPEPVRTMLTTGLLGAFTTFSTFALEASALLERGALGAAAAYIGGSVALSLLGLFAGIWLMRTVLM
jgi:CrcB protein